MVKIPLFDIDKTLVTGSNQVHLDAFDWAVKQVYGLEGVSVRAVEMHGKVDAQILLEMLELYQVPREQARPKLPEAFAVMVDYYQSHLTLSDVQLIPGVLELLQQLQAAHVPTGLLTGNIEALAHHKLGMLGIDQFFQFGGFGHMAEARFELFGFALKRAHEMGIACELNDFLAFGDTQLDIEAANKAGVKAVGVASGDFSQEQLLQVGADDTVQSLADHAKVKQLLGVA